MSAPNNYEQYMLELINAERAKTGAQPLAFNSQLNDAAEDHSQWMIATDIFSHTGVNGTSPTQRMQAAGYTFSGSWANGENIAWASLRSPDGLNDEVQLLHTNLMNSPGHKANILNASFREVGLGFETGPYQSWQGAFVTQDFAKSGSSLFVTGVAFDDKDGDHFYDPGEGLGGLSVSITGGGHTYTTATYASGGYNVALGAGTYTVTFSGGGFATTSKQVTVGTGNVKVDLIDPATGSGGTTPPTNPPPAGGQTLTGSGANDTLHGAAAGDTISGLGGTDRLYGHDGADKLDGGTGNDVLSGGAGADTLTGGSGSDHFAFDTLPSAGVDRITDFSSVFDTIDLSRTAFTALAPGALPATAYWQGAAAHDASDRIIYNRATGDLIYDPDGTGSAKGAVFAHVAPGTSLTSGDFLVV